MNCIYYTLYIIYYILYIIYHILHIVHYILDMRYSILDILIICISDLGLSWQVQEAQVCHYAIRMPGPRSSTGAREPPKLGAQHGLIKEHIEM